MPRHQDAPIRRRPRVLVGEGRVSFRDIALRHRRQAARQALSFGTLAGLDQSQESARTGRDEADRRLTPPVLA